MTMPVHWTRWRCLYGHEQITRTTNPIDVSVMGKSCDECSHTMVCVASSVDAPMYYMHGRVYYEIVDGD